MSLNFAIIVAECAFWVTIKGNYVCMEIRGASFNLADSGLAILVDAGSSFSDKISLQKLILHI